VVSIGNLTTGGTGKTPAVVMLAEWASRKGFRVGILSRGYGGQYRTKVLEVSDGIRIKAYPEECGDEPYLMAKRLSGIPVVISKKRYLAGLFAHKEFGCDFFILDDGFQHLGLNRDLDLVLIDGSRPFGNGHVLPWGPLREPIDQLCRADAFILTRVKRPGEADKTVEFLKGRFSSTPIFFGDHLPEEIVFPYLEESHNPGILKGKRVVAFAGIARPENFRETLIALGTDTVFFKAFRDHYRFKQGEIDELRHMKERTGAEYILTTEKDWARISRIAAQCHDMGYVRIKFGFLSEGEDFFKMISSAFSDYVPFK